MVAGNHLDERTIGIPSIARRRVFSARSRSHSSSVDLGRSSELFRLVITATRWVCPSAPFRGIESCKSPGRYRREGLQVRYGAIRVATPSGGVLDGCGKCSARFELRDTLSDSTRSLQRRCSSGPGSVTPVTDSRQSLRVVDKCRPVRRKPFLKGK